jgi:uncharacterized phage protein (TIGR02218 family)
MSYLSRPVFDWPLQWVGPSQSVTYDVKPLTMGFGGPEFAPTARQVARGWRCSFWLKTAAEIEEYETWSAALKGRLNGFWFPEPSVVGTVISTQSAGVINIRACGLDDVWNTEARLYVWLVDLDGNGTAAAVTEVSTPSAGVERVTIDETLSPVEGWRLHRLLYVRQADDVEQARNIAEHWEERELSVVELPEEYAAAETGDEPVWLYYFYMEPPGEAVRPWYYTSFAEALSSSGNTYVPIPITHQGISLSTDSSEESVKIETVLKDGTPWAEMLIDAPERPLWVIIAKSPYAAPSSSTVLFGGQIKELEVEGRKVSMTFSSWLDGAGRIPSRLFGAGCPYDLYDTRTCGVDAASHELAVTFDAISGMTAVVTGVGLVAQPANYFARGTLDTGSGATRETRMVLASTSVAAGATQLTLSRPLRQAAVAGSATLRPGCSRNRGDCETKFANLVNYGGFDFMPRDNPVFKGPEVDGSGGKK